MSASNNKSIAIISHPSPGILEIARDLARLHLLDTRHKANVVGLPDCGTEICFSLDHLVSVCPSLSPHEEKDSKDPLNYRHKGTMMENVQEEPWIIAGITRCPIETTK